MTMVISKQLCQRMPTRQPVHCRRHQLSLSPRQRRLHGRYWRYIGATIVAWKTFVRTSMDSNSTQSVIVVALVEAAAVGYFRQQLRVLYCSDYRYHPDHQSPNWTRTQSSSSATATALLAPLRSYVGSSTGSASTSSRSFVCSATMTKWLRSVS